MDIGRVIRVIENVPASPPLPREPAPKEPAPKREPATEPAEQ